MLMQQFFCRLLITIMQMLIKVIIAQFLLTEEKLIHRHNQLYHSLKNFKSLHLLKQEIETLKVHYSNCTEDIQFLEN